MLILNLKTYPESSGQNLEKLLNAVSEYSSKNQELASKIYSAPQSIELISSKTKFNNLNIIAQHVDNIAAGSTTGWIPADNLVGNGISFSIYNHSEHRVWDDNMLENIKALQSKGLKLIVCCENSEEASNLLEAQPYAIAYEPKDLIGSGISVTTRPEAVKEFLSIVKGKTIPIIGAGVSTGEDVKTSLNLGAEGVLLASAFVKAADPVTKLEELVSPFRQ